MPWNGKHQTSPPLHSSVSKAHHDIIAIALTVPGRAGLENNGTRTITKKVSPPLTTRLLQWWQMITGGSSFRHLSPHSAQVCPWQSWHAWLRDLAHPSSSFPICFEYSCCRRGRTQKKDKADNKDTHTRPSGCGGGGVPGSVGERTRIRKRPQNNACQHTPTNFNYSRHCHQQQSRSQQER